MKVRELIEMLSDCDPDATVKVINQQEYPFEYAIGGIAVRKDYTEYMSEDEDGEPFVEPFSDWQGNAIAGNDVLIGASDQTGYGSKDAFDAMRRG